MAERIDFSSNEKTDEKEQYENKERQLQDEIFFVSDRNAKYIAKAGDEYSEIFEKTGRPDSEKVKEAFSNFSSGLKSTSRATLEAFFRYVDKKIPSLYDESQPFVEEFLDETDDKKEEETAEMAEFNYRRAANMQGENEEANLTEIAKIISDDGGQDEYHIKNSLKHLSDGIVDFQEAFSRAIVDYINEKSSEKEYRLAHIHGDYEGVLANSLFNIATIFDDMDTEFSDKMFDPTITLAAMATKGSEDLFYGIMDYLEFKTETPLEKSEK